MCFLELNASKTAIANYWLQEELNELKLAVEKSSNVDIFDALLDLKFVLIGSLGKMGLSYKDVINGYEFVLQKNETKSKTKDSNGKITKPIGFVGPEKDLQKILESRNIS